MTEPRLTRSRLVGQETEYAIRWRPDTRGDKRPSHYLIHEALRESVGQQVRTAKGERFRFQRQYFVENGGAFVYEVLPFAPHGGLIEGATPECGDAAELLVYQRAQERLLVNATRDAEACLSAQGYDGQLGLVKNCRDAEGHIYGAQENYEAEAARGWRLWLWRTATLVTLLATVPVMAAFFVLMGVIIATVIGAALTIGLLTLTIGLFGLLGIRRARSSQTQLLAFLWGPGFSERVDIWSGWTQWVFQMACMVPVFLPLALVQRVCVFARPRRLMEAFLLSRCVVSGAGTLMEDGRFCLSEKAVSVNERFRWSVLHWEHAIFDTGNLMKGVWLAALGLLTFRTRPAAGLLRRRQRMQLGLSDSNRCDYAEYLKTGTTRLVLDMVESGFLRDGAVPRMRRPLGALQIFNGDAGLEAAAETRRGPRLTALQVQQTYLQMAKRYLTEGTAVSMEDWRVVELWEEVLNMLADDRERLVGRLDWVSKGYLIGAGGQDAGYAVRKKMDLRYHEIGQGGWEQLERAGVSPRLTAEGAVERALREPPSTRSARMRSDLIRELAFKGRTVRVNWDSFRVGILWNRKVIPFR